jgi:hypothetical protein
VLGREAVLSKVKVRPWLMQFVLFVQTFFMESLRKRELTKQAQF